MTGSQPTLPGLGPERPDAGRMEKAAALLLETLRDKGLIKPEHVLLEQTILDLARAVGISANTGKAAGMAMAAKELREYLALLPKSNDDAMAALMAEIDAERRRAEAERQSPDLSSTERQP